MSLLTNFFNPTERQARRLDGLRTKRTDTRAAFDAAVAAGDDAAEAKAWATWQRLDGELRAAEAAKAAAERQSQQAQAEADRNAKAALLAEAERTQRAAEAASLALVHGVEAQQQLAADARTAFEAARAARRAAGLGDEFKVAGLSFADVWNFALRSLARRMEMQLPQVVKWSGTPETLEQRIARVNGPINKAA